MSNDKPQRLRTGRSVGRTIYVQTGDEPSKEDELVGVMDTPQLAALVVTAVNAWLTATSADSAGEEGATADVVRCSKCDEAAVCRVHVKAPNTGRVLIDKLVCPAHRDEEERLAAFGMAQVEFLPPEDSDG